MSTDIRPTQPPRRFEPPSRPQPRFQLEQIVDVPKRVDEGKRAQIIGREWAPDNSRLRGKGWSYSIRFYVWKAGRNGSWHDASWQFGGEWWQASEEELVSWQGG